MSAHNEFFQATPEKATDLVTRVNWKHVLRRYDVIGPHLVLSAAPSKKLGARRDLAHNLGLLLDQPVLREMEFRKVRDEALHRLCRLGDRLFSADAIALTRKLILAGADVNALPQTNSTRLTESCLVEAIASGAPDGVVQLLLDAGATKPGDTDQLFGLCKRKATEDLLRRHCVNSKHEVHNRSSDNAVMHEGAKGSWTQGSSGADLAERSSAYERPQSSSVSDAATRNVKPRGSRSGIVNLPGSGGLTPLMCACISDDPNSPSHVKLLLQGGADVNQSDCHGKTALMWAVEEAGDIDVVQTLLDCHPVLSAVDELGNTALHYCAARRRNEHLTHQIAEMLLRNGAEIDAPNQFGHTPLMLIAQNSAQASRVLLEHGASLTRKDVNGLAARDYASAAVQQVLGQYEAPSKGTSLGAQRGGVLALKRGDKAVAQVKDCRGLAEQLVREIEALLEDKTDDDVICHRDAWTQILRSAQLATEAYSVQFETRASEDVDRTASMLSGPFFLSKVFPPVKGWYPVVQLNLASVSKALGVELGDGLLQVWESTKNATLVLRRIPGSAIAVAEMLPFRHQDLPLQDKTLLDCYWDSDPANGQVRIFSTLVSLGCQAPDFRNELDEIEAVDSVPRNLKRLARRFQKSSARALDRGESPVQLCGTFPAVQYDHISKGLPLLLTFNYGPSGSAEVFLDVGAAGQVNFSLDSAAR